MLPRVRRWVPVVAGFLIGLFLASLDKVLWPIERSPLLDAIIEVVDWIAPPLSGALVALSILYALRHKQRLETERAASRVLAERLAGTERRQALWVVAAAVAHDIKNPLHNLHLLVEELAEEQRPEQREELLRRVRDNLSRASERLKELARVGGSASEDEHGPVDVADALDEVRKRLQPNAASARTAILVDCPPGLKAASAPLAFRSAVENVAANALEAIGERGSGGTLALRARPDPSASSAVEIVVEDDGPGIPDSIKPRLFVPFAASHHGSTGLGLAIARALARAGGGDLVCAESVPGKTQFRFTFQAR